MKNLLGLIFCCIAALSSVATSAYACEEIVIPEHEQFAKEVNSLYAIETTMPLDEMLSRLFCLKDALQAEGYVTGPMWGMCVVVRNALKQIGVDVNDQIVEEIFNRCVAREMDANAIDRPSFDNIKSAGRICDEPLFVSSDDFAKGFTKALGGTLLCSVSGVAFIDMGSDLVYSGMFDMVEGDDDDDFDDDDDEF